MDILKILFLFVAVLYGMNILIKMYYKNDVYSSHVVMTAIGIVGFLVLQFKLL